MPKIPTNKPTYRNPKKRSSIVAVINKNQNKKIDDFSTDAQVLFGLLTLIVDIKYRNRYGKPISDQKGRGYGL